MHEQWCLLISIPPTHTNPAAGLPADASHGQSDVPAPIPDESATLTGSKIQLPPAPTFRYRTHANTSARPSMIAPDLDTPGCWCAGKRGKHLSYRLRPGGPLETLIKPKFDDTDQEAKKNSRPDRLNLCHNEDPYICWKIFGTQAGCPHANDESKCRYFITSISPHWTLLWRSAVSTKSTSPG